VRARLRTLLVVAVPLAGADLLVKAAMATEPLGAHHRSHAWVAVSAALLVVMALSTRLPSRQFALAAGVLAGGLLGNLVSAVTHGGVVENPFVAGDVAFNLADLLVLVGLVLVAVAAMRLAVRFRHLLPTHTIPGRIVRHVNARLAARRA
jgi:Signal peptidase (SPase) II